MSKRTFCLVFALQVSALVLSAGILADVAAHRRDDPYLINQFGYRGPARASKRPGERRVTIVGGSAAFAAQTAWPDTLGPALTEAIDIHTRARNDRPVVDVNNVAEASAGADTYVGMMKTYDYLRPDVVTIYDGYDEVGTRFPSRDDSFVFRSWGYLPILAGSGRQLARSSQGPRRRSSDDPPVGSPSCADAFSSYCGAMVDTVRFALASRHQVFVVSAPYRIRRDELQQRAVAAELARLFGGEARFRYLNLGGVTDLHDGAPSLDGVSTTAAANRRIAALLAEPLIELLGLR